MLKGVRVNLSFNTPLKNVHALEKCAQNLAELMKNHALKAILFQGDLGSGKTTFTRAFVQSLPGGSEAEVSSPSFTLCNAYTTQPRVLHCDLYRAAHSMPEELWDALEDTHTLCIIEWAEYLPENVFAPFSLQNAQDGQDYLDIHLKICEEGRLMEVAAHGYAAEALLEQWQKSLFNKNTS